MNDRPPSRWFYLLAGIVVVAGFGVAVGVSFLVSSLGFLTRVGSLPRAAMPGTVQVELPAGNYTVYYEPHSLINGRVYLAGSPDDLFCRLSGPPGAVELRNSATQFTYNVGSYSGQSIFIFRAPQDGRYTLACYSHQPNRQPVVLALGRGHQWSTAALLVAGAGALLAGLAVGALVYAKRRRWATARARSSGAGAGAGAGGYPPTPTAPAGTDAAYPGEAPGQAAPGRTPAAEPAIPDSAGPAPQIPPPPDHPAPWPALPDSTPPGLPISAQHAPARSEPGQPAPWPAMSRPVPPGGDGLANAALILAILGVIVAAVPLALASLARTRTSPHRGRGLARAALAISAAWALIAAVAVIAVLPGLRPGHIVAATALSPSPSPSAQPSTGSTQVGFDELRVGDCIESRPGPSVDYLTRVSCAAPHELELLAIPNLGGGPWPGEKTLQTRGDRLCSTAFNSYVGIPADQSELELISYFPDEPGWTQGDHTVDCFTSDPAVKTTGTVRGSHR